MIAITFDLDWAPDKIVDEVIMVFDSFEVPTTLFCTNFLKDVSGNSSSVAGRFHDRHEIALHPNFQHVADYDTEWDELLKLYPEAQGWRSHNGVTGWPILEGGVARGLRYEVYPAVFQGYITPSPVNRRLKNYHVFTTAFWDSHMLHEPSFSWSVLELPLRNLFEDESKIVVLGFHPNIVFYDMRSIVEYDTRKPSYHHVDETQSFRGRRPAGPMKLLRDLLETVPSCCFTTLSSFGARSGLW
jgi:polysaccharide deactylase WbmS-like protein